MSDWDDACDPVPAKAETARTPEELARIRRTWTRWQAIAPYHINKDSVPAHWVDEGFDEMGA